MIWRSAEHLLADLGLKPLVDTLRRSHAPDLDCALAQLRRDLAVVMSAEALLTLTDLCELTPDDAITSAAATATTLTKAVVALAEEQHHVLGPRRGDPPTPSVLINLAAVAQPVYFPWLKRCNATQVDGRRRSRAAAAGRQDLSLRLRGQPLVKEEPP